MSLISFIFVLHCYCKDDGFYQINEYACKLLRWWKKYTQTISNVYKSSGALQALNAFPAKRRKKKKKKK